MSKKPPPAWWVRVLRSLGLGVFLLFVVGAVFIMLCESDFLYIPIKGDVGPSPGEEAYFTTSDGVKIHAWYGTNPQAKVTLLWFHGNAGNLENRRDMFTDLRGLPANVLAIDYRGYGKSDGKPDEAGLYRDARAAYDWLCTKTTPDRIVIFGKSVGGGPACELASQVKCGGLIVQSAFTSAPDMAPLVIPVFPARWFMRTKYDNLSKVPKIACPKLFIHSRADDIIPFSMGEKLFAAAAEPKESVWFDQADHNSLWVIHSRAYYVRLKKFIDGIEK